MAKKSKIVKKQPIHTDSDWNFEILEKYDKEIQRIAKDYLKLDWYPNQIEIVSSEQMIDAYSLVGLPISYPHWSFGKQFVSNASKYIKGQQGLAYELVINSNPCISYNMEDNTFCMMVLVMAHAAYGHNSMFKCNYMFKDWTDADTIIDYMAYAKDFVTKCEEKYGEGEVEMTLDAAHSIMDYGVDKYKKPEISSFKKETERLKKIIEAEEENFDDIWRTLPPVKKSVLGEFKHTVDKFPTQPEENILLFIEENAPSLPEWKRELLRIVRKVAQYFYPQSQTKVINEGWATFVHYLIIHKLHEEGLVNDGFMLEFYRSHTGVVFQPSYDDPRYSGLNPYTLGFNIFIDIKRICENPTEEDRKWFPNLVDKDWLEECTNAMKNYRDDSFISQYLSPKVIRDMKLFMIVDEAENSEFVIGGIHNERGYIKVREALSQQYSRNFYIPNIQVTRSEKFQNRRLTLTHDISNGVLLDEDEAMETLAYVNFLWGFPCRLFQVDEKGTRKTICKIEE